MLDWRGVSLVPVLLLRMEKTYGASWTVSRRVTHSRVFMVNLFTYFGLWHGPPRDKRILYTNWKMSLGSLPTVSFVTETTKRVTSFIGNLKRILIEIPINCSVCSYRQNNVMLVRHVYLIWEGRRRWKSFSFEHPTKNGGKFLRENTK